MWGYAAEMTLKAAYFALRGHLETDVITLGTHIHPAIDRGRRLFGIHWPSQGAGHNVRAWAELLVAERAARPGAAYKHLFGRNVHICGQRIGAVWRETLRYHKNVAYLFEQKQVREATEWLLSNSKAL